MDVHEETKRELLKHTVKLALVPVASLAIVIWQAIDPTIWNHIEDKVPKKVLWAMLGLLALLGILYIIHLQRQLADKEEISKDKIIASLQCENSELKKQVQSSEGSSQRITQQAMNLEQEIHELTHIETLTDEMEQILQLVAHDQTFDQMWYMTETLQMHAERVTDILTTLTTSRYVKSNRFSLEGDPIYELTDKGRRYLIRNNLI